MDNDRKDKNVEITKATEEVHWGNEGHTQNA